jgi:hypothetical protein
VGYNFSDHLRIFTSAHIISTCSQLLTSAHHTSSHLDIFSHSISISLSLPHSHLHILHIRHLLSFDESHTYTCDYPPVRSRAIPRFILVCKKVILPYIPDLRSFLGTGDIRQTFWIGPPKPTVQIAAKLDPELSAGSLDTVDGNQICTD